jgi:hypothetical protein
MTDFWLLRLQVQEAAQQLADGLRKQQPQGPQRKKARVEPQDPGPLRRSGRTSAATASQRLQALAGGQGRCCTPSAVLDAQSYTCKRQAWLLLLHAAALLVSCTTHPTRSSLITLATLYLTNQVTNITWLLAACRSFC